MAAPQPGQAPQEAAPAQGAQQDPQESQEQGGGIGEIINDIGQGLMRLQQGLSQSPALKQEADMASQLLEGFKQLVSALSQEDGAPQGGSGVVPPEAGAQQVRPAL